MPADVCSLSASCEPANGNYHVKALGQFTVIFISHHLEKVQMSETREYGQWFELYRNGFVATELLTKGVGGWGWNSSNNLWPVESRVLMTSKLVDDWLDPQHQEFVP